LLGRRIPNEAGAYYPPTRLTDVRKGMPAFDQELFGPVGDPRCGRGGGHRNRQMTRSLAWGGGVITRDLVRGEHIAVERIESGSVRSDPRLPFGGIKDSGYCRELSAYVVKEFVKRLLWHSSNQRACGRITLRPCWNGESIAKLLI